jgi:hypothetical protein
VAAAWRLAGAPELGSGRLGAVVGTTIGLAAVTAFWLVQGPLASGWARRAGTPAKLLASTPRAVRSAARTPAHAPTAARTPALQRPFTAAVHGTLHQGRSSGGLAVIDLRMHLSGGPSGVLRVRIAGNAAQGGGVSMTRSAVTLGPRSAPGTLQGRIDALQGTSIDALLGAATGPAVRLRADLALAGSTVSGHVSGRPVGAGG